MKTCAIIDPYSSSNLYAPELKARGYGCIAVLSQAEPTELIAGSFRREDFLEVLRFNGDLDGIVRELRKRSVELVIPGMEMGLELADAIGSRMGSAIANDPATSRLRRHKFEMIEAVRRHGLRAPAQFHSGDPAEILAWARANEVWPLVAKPADSGGADRVAYCGNEQELGRATQACLGARGRQGRMIDEVVVQQLLQGTEYIVDAVSRHGSHRIVDIWKYERLTVNGACFVYDTKELVPCEGEEQKALIDYTRAALDAVGLRNGPSHSEVMLTPDGPALIEINARFGGSMAPILNRHCLGQGQLDEMINVLFSPDSFHARVAAPYRIAKNCLAVYFISTEEGRVVSAEALDRIRALPSFHRLSLNAPPGAKLSKTVDMFTMPGMVELVHESRQQLRKDHALIRAMERSGQLYVTT